jgi:hypothetical protein
MKFCMTEVEKELSHPNHGCVAWRERAPILVLTSLQKGGVSILYVLTCVSDILPRFGVARREFQVLKEEQRGSWFPVGCDLYEFRLCE